MRASLTPEQHALGLQRSAATNSGRQFTDETRRKMSVSQIIPRPKGIFGTCRICEQLTYGKRSPSVYDQRSSHKAQFHKQCLDTWRSENQSGFVNFLFPEPAQRRRPLAKDFADQFELFLRHLLRDEPIGRFKHDGGSGLAAEFDLTREAIQKRIQRCLKLLPTDGRGGRKLAIWSKALLAAAQALA